MMVWSCSTSSSRQFSVSTRLQHISRGESWWPDIKAAFDALWCHDVHNIHNVNGALLTLLLKTTEAAAIKDYLPISLIHLIGKLLSKVLANRLAPHLNELVHRSQSVITKGRLLHDNFRFVQASAKLLHACRVPSLLLKVDIARAFDSVAWPFLLEILEHLGFPSGWRNWVTALLSSASTQVIMNIMLGDKIFHATGLH
jgi:hypothetical protein